MFLHLICIQIDTKRLGSKPCVVFVGEQWEATSEHRNLRSIFLDFVRGQDVTGINLASLDHVICFTLATDKIYMRTYSLQLKKPADSSSNVPKTRLVVSAPAADFT
jgi:ribosome production factor 2